MSQTAAGPTRPPVLPLAAALSAIVLATVAVSPAASVVPYPDAERVGSATFLGTSLSISQRLFDAGEAGTVVLAREDRFPDALGASAVAARFSGPILYTPSDELHPATRAEIERILPSGQPVYLMGGAEALAPAIESELDEMGYRTPRFAGATRIETAALAARVVGTGPQDTVIIARSHGKPDATQGWVDSVSCGAWAAETTTPVLLTNPAEDRLHPATRSTIERLEARRAVVCGGSEAVPQSHTDDLAELGVSVQRHAGRDRVETAVDVARSLWGYSVPDGHTFLVVPGWGSHFGFGLAAAPLAAARDAPLLLVDTNEPTTCGPGEPSRVTLCYLLTHDEPATGVVAVGSSAIISDEVLSAAAAAAGLQADTTPPPTPQGVGAADTPQDDGTRVTVSWEAVQDPDGGPVRYQVYVREAAEAAFTRENSSPAENGPTGETRLTVGGLTTGVEYQFAVASRDQFGNESGLSQVVAATPTDEVPAAPETPPNLENVEPFHIRVTWVRAPESDAAGYVIHRAEVQPLVGCEEALVTFTTVAEIDDPATTSFTDTEVTEGQAYCYRYAVVDTSGQQGGFSPVNGPFTAQAPS